MHKKFKFPKGQFLANVPGYRDPVDGGRCKVEAKEADATGRAQIAFPADGGRCGVEAKEADAVERAWIAYPADGGRCGVEAK